MLTGRSEFRAGRPPSVSKDTATRRAEPRIVESRTALSTQLRMFTSHGSRGTIRASRAHSGPRARHSTDLRGRAGTVVCVRLLRRQALGQREERLGAECGRG